MLMGLQFTWLLGKAQTGIPPNRKLYDFLYSNVPILVRAVGQQPHVPHQRQVAAIGTIRRLNSKTLMSLLAVLDK